MTRPSVARVYDFWLGGKDNFAVDREMGSRMAEINPSLPRLVRDNRRFRWVAGTGGVPSSRPVFALAAAAVKSGG